MSTIPLPVAATRRRRLRPIIAATVGCLLEWYDFAVYGYFAVVIAKLFFPTGSDWTSLLLAVATFGVGFAMRPVGALVLGTLADRRGRKAALSLTITTMVFGTALIAFAPTHAQIGLWAPVLIVIGRLIQGFSAGGEMGVATAWLVEYAGPGRRMVQASFQQMTQLTALLAGSLTGALVTGLLSPAEVEAWGWRVPFMVGLVIGPIGWYIRRHTEEPPEFAARQAARHPQAPRISPGHVIRAHPRAALAGFCITILWTICTYFFLVYMPTYAIRELGIAADGALISNAVALAVAVLFVPGFAILADRRGPKPVMTAAALVLLAASWPALATLTSFPHLPTLILVQAALAIPIAAFTGPAGGAMAGLFPPETRATGMSIAYNFAVTLFGGFAPFIATWAIGVTGDPHAPAWYLCFGAAAAVIGVRLMGGRRG
ncbi:MFS transporter [Tistrella mobilis]|uniref:MFS transporter n=1 Tax=Tistrella mobilis TaxID=171437 RepID=UPI0031F60B23